MGKQNLDKVEIKARSVDNKKLLSILLGISASKDYGIFDQVDTYFRVDSGSRLKIRQTGEKYGLISYSRENLSGQKRSAVNLRVFPSKTDGELKLAKLIERFGVLAVVKKRRQVIEARNVRIHLDEVEGLGKFVEIEAVGSGNFEQLRERCESVMNLLGIQQENLVNVSYTDLMLAKK